MPSLMLAQPPSPEAATSSNAAAAANDKV